VDSQWRQVDLMLTNSFYNKKVRLYPLWSLAFSFLLIACSGNERENPPVTIHWKDNRAESIIIPMKLLSGIPKDSIRELVHVQLAKMNTPMIGEFTLMDGAARFRPAIVFTRGLRYEVRSGNKLLSEFEIPRDDTDPAPTVLSIYPSSGTLPENLLKIYIAFSKPMQEGEAGKKVAVIKDGNDTIPAFLDLDQELWNKERTVLTLWLDPGRIKRDLQPNVGLGTPLHQGSHYQVLVKKHWRDANGVAMANDYQKDFVAGPRDSTSPDQTRWTIHKPQPESTQPLKIDLHESLDYVLL
jgi:hypothetical protein